MITPHAVLLKAIEDITTNINNVKGETSALSRDGVVVREESAPLKKASFAAKDRVASALTALKQAEVRKLCKLHGVSHPAWRQKVSHDRCESWRLCSSLDTESTSLGAGQDGERTLVVDVPASDHGMSL